MQGLGDGVRVQGEKKRRNGEARGKTIRGGERSAFMPSGSKFAPSRRGSGRFLLHLALNLRIWLPKLAWAKLISTALSISRAADNTHGLGDSSSIVRRVFMYYTTYIKFYACVRLIFHHRYHKGHVSRAYNFSHARLYAFWFKFYLTILST